MRKLTPYKQLLEMGKAAVEAALVPIRVAKTKKEAELEMMKIDEKLLNLEAEIQELTVQHPLPFDKVISKLDEIALLERRKEQFDQIVAELFSEEERPIRK